jgi:hypothetical protein
MVSLSLCSDDGNCEFQILDKNTVIIFILFAVIKKGTLRDKSVLKAVATTVNENI